MKVSQAACKQLCQMLPPLGRSRAGRQEVSLPQAGGQVTAGGTAFNMFHSAVKGLLRLRPTDSSSPNAAESTYQEQPDLFDPARIYT